MTTTPFHIIAFDVPHPPNYGGIIDVFYKLKALKKCGAQLILHCFYYEGHNLPTDELNNYCLEVHYYKRTMRKSLLFTSRLPFIVSSRANAKLLERLNKDDYPILFEGLHTCFYLNHHSLINRKKIVRAHNIEHNYYAGLQKLEKKPFKKYYLQLEAKRLKQFEQQLKSAAHILSIAKMDVSHFSQYSTTHHIPPFYNDTAIEQQLETKKQVLFHGNLAVKENENVALFILNELADAVNYPIVIAGKDPSAQLLKKINAKKGVDLYANPTAEKMNALIHESHINLLLSFQQTGVKLKLLHALQLGNHIIINDFMNDDNLFVHLCQLKNTPSAIVTSIHKLMDIPYTLKNKAERKKAFLHHFDMTKNAEKIIEIINTY